MTKGVSGRVLEPSGSWATACAESVLRMSSVRQESIQDSGAQVPKGSHHSPGCCGQAHSVAPSPGPEVDSPPGHSTGLFFIPSVDGMHCSRKVLQNQT